MTTLRCDACGVVLSVCWIGVVLGGFRRKYHHVMAQKVRNKGSLSIHSSKVLKIGVLISSWEFLFERKGMAMTNSQLKQRLLQRASALRDRSSAVCF